MIAAIMEIVNAIIGEPGVDASCGIIFLSSPIPSAARGWRPSVMSESNCPAPPGRDRRLATTGRAPAAGRAHR
jgi:hypothetical protein